MKDKNFLRKNFIRISSYCFVAILIVLVFSGIMPKYAEARLPVVRIGIVQDGTWERNSQIIDLFKKEILELTRKEFDVQFPADKILNGNWNLSKIQNDIDQLLSDPDVDLIIALGAIASHEVCRRRDLKKPVIAPFVMDAKVQKLPYKNGTSGVKNLNYIDTARSVQRDFNGFHGAIKFKNPAILVDGATIEAIPEIRGYFESVAKEKGVNIHIVNVESSADQALEKLPASTDAVLVTRLNRLNSEEFAKLIAGLNQRRLPSFCFSGRDEVEQGILLGKYPKDYLQFIARSTAINIYEILSGQTPESRTVEYAIHEKLIINMATARAIDVYPSIDLRTEAELLFEDAEEVGRILTLDAVVQEAIIANLDLAAANKGVAAGQMAVYEQFSRLLPQVELGTEARIIDTDRAATSGGLQPRRSWTGSVTGSQLIYSDSVWRDFTVERRFQEARVEDRETIRLDVVEAASTTYLNVLRTKTIEGVQRNNLLLTRANLERARMRVKAGAAGPDEVYRWESSIANDRQEVLRAETGSLNARILLNRVLHRPVQEPFIVQEAEISDPYLVLDEELFKGLMDDPKKLALFKDFMVKEGLEIAPELSGLDARIAAQERVLTSSRLAFFLPDFFIQGGLTGIFADSGPGNRGGLVSPLDNIDWNVGINATYPFFVGGKRFATLKRAKEDLARIQIEREAIAERIEERILNAINFTRASYPSIQLAQDAADAADKNLELVTDSYTRGIKSIIDLIDAQNQSLTSDLNAANAVNDFLVDLMQVQRSVGRFDFFMSQADRQAWLQRFEAYSEIEGQ